MKLNLMNTLQGMISGEQLMESLGRSQALEKQRIYSEPAGDYLV